MRMAGYLLIALALVTGAVAATNAYLPRLDRPPQQLAGLVLNATAGTVHDPQGELLAAARRRGPLLPQAVQVVSTRPRIRLHVLAAAEPPGAELAADAETGILALADRQNAQLIGPIPETEGAEPLYVICLGMDDSDLRRLQRLAEQQAEPVGMVQQRGGGLIVPVSRPAGWAEAMPAEGVAELAYLSLLVLPEPQLAQARVQPRTGLVVHARDQRVPLVRQDVVLTEPLIGRLQQAGVERVRVKSFQFGRWTGRWAFLLGAVGLVAGALLVRAGPSEAQQADARRGGHEAPADPLAVLQRMDQILQQTRQQVRQAGDPAAQRHRIVESLGRLQRNEALVFADLRPQLVQRLGLGGFAQLMDHFAAAERQLNRAWSSAVDGADDEALQALDLAAQRMNTAATWLAAQVAE